MQKLRFLVVDDASFIRDLIKRALKTQFAQCELDEAVNGKKAQALLNKKKYDLVLCDWEMPEMSGLEVLSWLREHEKENSLAKTPFIMVTSRGDKSHVIEAVGLGVSDYIGKPFSNEQLLKKVLKLLSVNHKDLIRAILSGRSQMASPLAPASDAASLLTGSSAKAAPKPAAAPESASLLTAGSVSSKLVAKPGAGGAKKGKASLGKVTLRSPAGQWQGVLKEVSLTDATVMIDFSETAAPSILEQVVIDVVVKAQPDAVARINTIVTSVALREKSLDCHTAIISIHVVDDDPEKIETLSHYVAEVR